MPAAKIDFTDATGAATLTSSLAFPADRFQGWTTIPRLKAEEAESLTGALHVYEFEALYDAAFRIEGISQANYPIAVRLVRHLLRGNTCAVTTYDASSNVYATCQMVKGAPPTLEMPDRRDREWTLTLTLRNAAATPVELLCRYG
jgi:hypothetical protein